MLPEKFRVPALFVLLFLSLLTAGAFLVFSPCPHVPSALSSGWQYLGETDGMLVFSSPFDADTTALAVLQNYEYVYYYARSTDVQSLNIPLPGIPPESEVIYMITVPDRCGAETYAVVSSDGGSKVYVGVVPLSDKVVPVHWKDMFCESLAGVFGPTFSVSEVLVMEGNSLRQYCYLRTAKDANSVHNILLSRGAYVGKIGGARVYLLDDNVVVNLFPGSPLGVMAYKTVSDYPS